MECKAPSGNTFTGQALDLIDTLWNVKEFNIMSLKPAIGDLIDTLWNVKDGHVVTPPRYFGFNRYIVECKVITVIMIAKTF